MPIEEICKLIAQKLLQGCMNHQQFANYYDFLGLEGYKLCHEYHFFEEMFNYRDFITYYIKHQNKLIPEFTTQSLNSFSIIPSNWYEYKREDTDINTRRNAVKSGLEKYIRWQDDVKAFLQDMYSQCIQQGFSSLSIELQKYICAVNEELKVAKKKYLEIKATDYDMPTVINEQEKLIKKYGKKLDQLRKESKEDVKPSRS